LIFVAELPDKSAIASLVLGTRYPMAWVFSGVAAAFAVHVVIAVAAGQLLSLLPHNLTEIVVACLFILGAFLIWREGNDFAEDEAAAEAELSAEVDSEAGDVPAQAGFWKVSSIGFGVIFIGEWGDLTQIMMANLAAKHDDPWSVGIGAVLGLWAVAAAAMLFGRTLLKVLPMRTITRVAAVVMLVLATITIIGVVNG
jgi:putative Ca2+/H+ antiporter (TMEM165/GDT1 family)